MVVIRFRKSQRPDSEVISLLERVLASARKGHLRTVLVVAVNPVHEAETAVAGDLTETRKTVLLGALSRAANTLIKNS